MAAGAGVADSGTPSGVRCLKVFDVIRHLLAQALPHLRVGVELRPFVLQLPENFDELEAQIKTAGETLNLSLRALICLTLSCFFSQRISETTS